MLSAAGKQFQKKFVGKVGKCCESRCKKGGRAGRWRKIFGENAQISPGYEFVSVGDTVVQQNKRITVEEVPCREKSRSAVLIPPS